MNIVYFIIIKLYAGLVFIAAIFGNSKAKLWISGRKAVFRTLKQTIIPGEKWIWVHASSLGEFEQGRPIIESIRKTYPQFKILLTFFSPSGYEIRKNYQAADYVCYLPMDGPINSARFVELVHPGKAIFIKYEYWHYYLSALKKRNIPVYLCSAIFRREQLFFKWYGGWYRKILSYFTTLFVQNEESKQLLEEIGFSNVLVSGDTRFDRVSDIASQSKELEEIRAFAGNGQCLIAGSSWDEDEALLARYINESSSIAKFIIAPHEIHPSHLERIEKLIVKKSIRYSAWKTKTSGNFDVLIIDNIGMLSSLYRYGQVAYIGGGFGKGIHNILEAATYGLPVLFGPNHHRFREAMDLLEMGGAFAISNYEELKLRLDDLFTSSGHLKQSGEIAVGYIRKNTGATHKIVSVVMEKQ